MAEDYWIKRERKHIEQSIKDDKVKLKRIKRNYDRAYAEIDKEIQAFYQRYATKEGITMSEAVKKVSESDVQAFSNKAKKYVKEKNFTPQANEQLRLYNLTMRVNRLEMLKADIGLELTAMANDDLTSIRNSLEQNTYDELNRQAGILGESMKFDKTVVDNIVNASFQNATFSQRIWSNQDTLKAEMDKLLSRGMIQGKNPKVLAREVRKQFDVSRYQAERLMITEMARVQTSAQETAFKEYGYEECTWIAEPSACNICKPNDGKVFKVTDIGTGEVMIPAHPQCRCSFAAYYDRDEFEKRMAEIEQAKNEETYEEITRKINKIDEKMFDLEDENYGSLTEEEAGDLYDKLYEEVKLLKVRRKELAPVTPYKELDKEDLFQYQEKAKLWYNKLEAKEVESIQYFTDAGHSVVNNYLNNPNNKMYSHPKTKESIEDNIAKLDSALSKFSLKEDISSYRGVSEGEIEYLKRNNTFSEFKSTSLDKKIAENFSKDNSGKGTNIVKFNLPKGTNGSFIGDNSKIRGEAEFLLARDTKYVYEEINGEKTITVLIKGVD